MNTSITLLVVAVLTVIGFYMGRRQALGAADGLPARLHSLPSYYGYYVAIWCGLPTLALLAAWLILQPIIVDGLVIGSLPAAQQNLPPDRLGLLLNDIRNIAKGDAASETSAVVVAAVAHLLLLMVTVPNLASPKKFGGPKADKVYVIQNVRFKPPARLKQQEIPKRKTRKIPIPDPTPNDPEPLIEEILEPPQLDLPEIGVDVFGIPDAPPGVTGEGRGQGPVQLGDGIEPPKKIYDPRPRYTEEARQARIQGTVILQAVVDVDGNVIDVKVLKGLPFGLDESAIDTVKTWKYEPATRGGEPVAVYLSLLVNFSLQ